MRSSGYSLALTKSAAFAFCVAASVSWNATARAATITTFDVPGAAYMYAGGINRFGAIVGVWQTEDDFNNGAQHGFVRAADGTMTTFDAAQDGNPDYTTATGINDLGDVAGWYAESIQGGGGSQHGYVRAANGAITSFDPPSGSIDANGVAGINNRGAVVGHYTDGNSEEHGFMREANGNFVSFDVPGVESGTLPYAINNSGFIAGVSKPRNSTIWDGFVRSPDGTITSFDIPGATSTFAVAINSRGAIAGEFNDASGASHGYVRAVDGTITTFDPPGSVSTGVGSISGRRIVGAYFDGSNIHGFLRSGAGRFTSIDVPGAAGTTADAIRRAIAGTYTDGSGQSHGFVRTR